MAKNHSCPLEHHSLSYIFVRAVYDEGKKALISLGSFKSHFLEKKNRKQMWSRFYGNLRLMCLTVIVCSVYYRLCNRHYYNCLPLFLKV